ncbi:MAG: type 4a pilus biogenesis protein PilO [Gemmatimonadaceae bacterium]
MAILPRGQREQMLVFTIFLSVVAVGAYWYFAYDKKAAVLSETDHRIQAMVEQTNRAKADIARGNASDLSRQLALYQQNFELIRTLVPQGNEVPALLEQVSTAARRVGLDLAQVDPQPVVEGEQYDTYRYGLGVLGSFHQIATFLANVGSLTRIVIPVNLTLQQPTLGAQANKPKPKGAKTATIEARFQLQTFVARKTPLAQPAKKSAGGAKS